LPDVQHFIVATAGHVDHGKSALIKALTGTDPDRLPEEQSRGITIDLGFAHLDLPAPGGGSAAFRLGIVDVPGHEDFVRNMVAGVASIDLALLVVAADDGWMPQTEEHAQILTYFGVRRAVVALTKADLTADGPAAVAALRARLRDSAFVEAPIVPTSVLDGRGLGDLKGALARVLSGTPPPRDIGKPRLPVDRVFTLAGTGTVVTGTLFGGVLRRSQSIVIQPTGKAARIRRIQSHSVDVEASGPGRRTALNLPDVDAASGVHRGEVVTIAGLGNPNDVLDVLLEISPRAERPLKDGLRIRVHHGSGNVAAQVALGTGKELAVGARAIAELRLEAPAFVFAGDRFTVRDWSEQHTLAGGIVLDPDATRKAFRSKDRIGWLERVAEALDDPARLVVAHVARDGAVRRSDLLLKSHFSKEDAIDAVDRLSKAGSVVIVGNAVVDAARWQALLTMVEGVVDADHRTHPERLGLPLTDLRKAIAPELPLDELFDSLVSGVCERGFLRAGAVIRRRSHRAALPEVLQAAGAKLGQALRAKPLDPPSRKELTPDPISQRALRFLIETGEVVEISADLVMTAPSVAQATTLVRTFISEHGPATVSDLRQVLGSSRRVVVPLLEHLDRTFVTLRQGDRRTVRR
jgi:selenocysteine-specific elongation factor